MSKKSGRRGVPSMKFKLGKQLQFILVSIWTPGTLVPEAGLWSFDERLILIVRLAAWVATIQYLGPHVSTYAKFIWGDFLVFYGFWM